MGNKRPLGTWNNCQLVQLRMVKPNELNVAAGRVWPGGWTLPTAGLGKCELYLNLV